MDLNSIVYLVVELTFFLVFVICFRDAWHRGKHGDSEIKAEDQWQFPNKLWVFIMLAAMVFTFTFEYTLTHKKVKEPKVCAERGLETCPGPPGSDAIYSYPKKALVAFGEIEQPDGTIKEGSAVPLWVPIGWALIIYLVMRTSDKLALVWYKRPVLDGLMALIIDFALDPVASLNEWWLWEDGKLPPGATWFYGVPATNFMAWVVIVGAFSFFIRLFQRWREGDGPTKGLLLGILSWPFRKLPKGWLGDLLVPALATIPSVLVVLNYTDFARELMVMEGWYTDGALLCSVIWGACLIWLFRDAPLVRRDHAHDHVLMFCPLIIYGVVLVALYTTRTAGTTDPLYDTIPELALFVPVSAILGGIVFAWPYSKPGPESWW